MAKTMKIEGRKVKLTLKTWRGMDNGFRIDIDGLEAIHHLRIKDEAGAIAHVKAAIEDGSADAWIVEMQLIFKGRNQSAISRAKSFLDYLRKEQPERVAGEEAYIKKVEILVAQNDMLIAKYSKQ